VVERDGLENREQLCLVVPHHISKSGFQPIYIGFATSPYGVIPLRAAVSGANSGAKFRAKREAPESVPTRWVAGSSPSQTDAVSRQTRHLTNVKINCFF
jgi:hypothetical protein